MQFIGEVIYQGNPAGGVLPHEISEGYEVPPFGVWQSESGRAHTRTHIMPLCIILTVKCSKLYCLAAFDGSNLTNASDRKCIGTQIALLSRMLN